MHITYDETLKLFRLTAGDMLYAMGITDGAYLAHIYFGKNLPDADLTELLRLDENPFTPSVNNRDKASYMDTLPFECPCFGLGDYREHAVEILDGAGMSTCDFRYVSHRIIPGKPGLPGLPATFGTEQQAMTLCILCRDEHADLELELRYSVFEQMHTIVRSAIVRNTGRADCRLKRLLSATLTLDGDGYDMLTLNGSWARERHVERCRLHMGKQRIDSMRGESSHQHNPFFALAEQGADEDRGVCYGLNLIYSGNFIAQAEVDQHHTTRAQIGINPTDFTWLLPPGEAFAAPEAVLVWSEEGLGGMSRTFHDLYLQHLIRSKYRALPRPVLINNWEATYFDFNEEKLLSIAREAAKLGIEMLVMDDGWFGHRDKDNSSLGDWHVYEKKLPGGLKSLVDKVRAMGLKFGIWFEPEMVSPDSDLYRAHPDWAIQVPGRELTLCREQYVLDYSRQDVREYVYGMLRDILTSADISYVKWDMNRQLTEVGSRMLPADRQRELWHRYVLGVYEMMERLVTEFPDLLLENCSGGGARFDPGMLYYSPQIWASDDTDAMERLKIQYGTSLCYPVSAMGAHVSDCPNHTVGRTTPFQTRGHVAMAGTFGYELDITKISPEDRGQIPGQIADYKRYSHIMRNGDQYRIGDPFGTAGYDAWIFVTKDKGEALFTYVQTLSRPNVRSRRIRLKGLNPESWYRCSENGKTYSGAYLMQAGLRMPNLWGDFQSRQIYLEQTGQDKMEEKA